MGLTRRIIMSVMACLTLTVFSQPTQQQEQWEWYLHEVVNDAFVGRNNFEYYYLPSNADMEAQRNKGEVTYFLNTPEGLNSKKARNLIDRVMASYDDIRAVSDWNVTSTTYWKEFRFEKNRFRFSLKRKALDDGTYYVSVTETASYYKSLGKKKKSDSDQKVNKSSKRKAPDRSTRSRKQIKQEDLDEDTTQQLVDNDNEDNTEQPKAMTEQERRRVARQREEAQKREQEQKRAEAKALKEAEKQRKAEEKKQRQEEERLKKEEKKRQREMERQEREQARREQQATAKPAKQQAVASRYHYDDIALWLSEKYDFTQSAGDENSCTMYSTAVKDVEMAKLAIKNALKGSDARMTVPWRLNKTTGEVETGYSVDGHVLIFAVGKNDDGQITLTVTEISDEQFEMFKHSLNN